MTRKILLAIALVALVAPATAAAYTDQGTAQVQIRDYWPKIQAGELDSPWGSAQVTAARVNPNRMWLDHGNWGGHLELYYHPWWDRDRTFQAYGMWDCIAMSPITVHCERRL